LRLEAEVNRLSNGECRLRASGTIALTRGTSAAIKESPEEATEGAGTVSLFRWRFKISGAKRPRTSLVTGSPAVLRRAAPRTVGIAIEDCVATAAAGACIIVVVVEIASRVSTAAFVFVDRGVGRAVAEFAVPEGVPLRPDRSKCYVWLRGGIIAASVRDAGCGLSIIPRIEVSPRTATVKLPSAAFRLEPPLPVPKPIPRASILIDGEALRRLTDSLIDLVLHTCVWI